MVWDFEVLETSWKQVQNDVQAIQSTHCRTGINIDMARNATTKRLIRAFKLQRPSPDNAKLALDSNRVKKLLSFIETRDYNDQLIRTWLCVALNAALRVSEYTCPCRYPTETQVNRLMRWKHVTWSTDANGYPYATISFDHSKTNKNLDIEYASLPCRCHNDASLPCGHCELQRLYRLAIQRAIHSHTTVKEAIIFQHENSAPLIYDDVSRTLKELCQCAGYTVRNYGTHSLRKGGIVDAIMDGCSDAVLLNLGRWESFSSIRSYIHLESEQLARIRTERFNELNGSTLTQAFTKPSLQSKIPETPISAPPGNIFSIMDDIDTTQFTAKADIDAPFQLPHTPTVNPTPPSPTLIAAPQFLAVPAVTTHTHFMPTIVPPVRPPSPQSEPIAIDAADTTTPDTVQPIHSPFVFTHYTDYSTQSFNDAIIHTIAPSMPAAIPAPQPSTITLPTPATIRKPPRTVAQLLAARIKRQEQDEKDRNRFIYTNPRRQTEFAANIRLARANAKADRLRKIHHAHVITQPHRKRLTKRAAFIVSDDISMSSEEPLDSEDSEPYADSRATPRRSLRLAALRKQKQ